MLIKNKKPKCPYKSITKAGKLLYELNHPIVSILELENILQELNSLRWAIYFDTDYDRPTKEETKQAIRAI